MEIEGTIKRIIYRNEDNGYTVLELCENSGGEVTLVGIMPLASVGERILASIEMMEHKAYGPQCKVHAYRTLAPATLSALVGYLSSGLIRGVGEVTARNIVAMFGMDTLQVMESEPERLAQVPGIGINRAQAIAESFVARKDMRDVMLALQEYGVTVSQAVKLYKIYGALCLLKLRENPYRLIEDVEGIGFKTADKLAQSMGIEKDSAFRMKAGVKYTLAFARQEGHTYLPYDKLVEVAADILNVDILPLENIVDEMIERRELARNQIGGDDAIALFGMDFLERECAQFLTLLNTPPASNPVFDIERAVAALEAERDVALAPSQREAVLAALVSGALVITGGPGTGKTTILQFVIRLFDKLGLNYKLCAPTGRAAKRMEEAAGKEARTIHRLLEYGYNQSGFLRNADNPLEADAVIVDEMSMVDIFLLHALLRALPAGVRLIMVGDADQLPSVGPGNVLRDIIASKAVRVIRLTDIFRQAAHSMITVNAHRVNQGIMPDLFSGSPDFCFERIEAVDAILRRVIGLYSGKTNKLLTHDPLRDVQVLSPMKKGTLGVINLNDQLQQALNPPSAEKRERRFGNIVFREGDKVMQVRNDYGIEWKRVFATGKIESGEGVFNGDLGTIMRIDPEEQSMTVLFDDERTAEYEFSMLDELELAYCVSIHKSQGSEFPVVILPLAGGPPMLMTRNLLYTAITRAVAQVYIVGREYAVSAMVQNADVKKRYSALHAYLSEMSAMGEGHV